MFFSRRIVFFVILGIFSGSIFCFAQTSKIDSLKNAIKTLPESGDKVEAQLQLSEIFFDSVSSTSEEYAREALHLSKRISYEEGMGTAYNKLGRIFKNSNELPLSLKYFDSALFYFQAEDNQVQRGIILNQMGIVELNRNHYDNARDYYQKSFDAFQNGGDSSRMANELLNIGITYEMQGFHSMALEYYFKCLELDEKLGYESGIASDYMSIALIFQRQKDFSKAEEYYHKSLELNEKLNDELSIAMVLVNLGVTYKDLGKYDQALSAQNRALETFGKADHRRGITTAYHNIAVVHFTLGDMEKACHYVRKSLELADALDNDHFRLVNEILLARIYFEEGQLKDAILLANQALQKATHLGTLTEQQEATALLGELYVANNQSALALQMMEKNEVLKDSIFNLEKSLQMQELQTKYETTQKENQIALLSKERALQESEIKRKSLQQNMMLGGVGLFALIGFILFRSYTSRQKQKRALLDQQLKNEKLEAERLQELDEAKSRFFANIAHEFRTPLTLILGPSEQILDENKDPKAIESAHMIRQNADKLLSLTNQLLDLSKLESGMIRLHPVRDDFIVFIKACVHSFESLAEEKDITILTEIIPDKLIMDFDPEKTSIIINNLISNAIKFTPPFGEISVLIEECQLSDSKAVEIKISDSGIGIPEKQLPYIFDRFYQVDDSATRKVQGTGIGLALTKELTELHSGEISVTSELNKGTTFIIKLPLRQDESLLSEDEVVRELVPDQESWAENPMEKKDLSESAYENKEEEKHSVLVVEDNPEVRKFIVDILRNFYHVMEAENGKTGMDKTIEAIPDLVISDVMMPEMDGFEFCDKVKSDERTSHIPVVLLTSKAGIDSKVEGLDVGADDYLAKPFNARELLARIKNLIKVRKGLQEKFGQTNDSSLFAKKEHTFIIKLKEVIEENIDKEAFNVVDLGKALAMSRTQVHRKLKALTNLSTSQFIRQFKLEKSIDLLKSGEHNVSEVAYMLGFNTPNYFSTCFNEHFGYPPSEVGRVKEKK